MRIRRFFHIILAVIALGIVWQTVSTWSRAMPGVQPESARDRTRERPATALPARAIRAGQRLAQQITDQDLFAPDRKRPVVVQQTVTTEPTPPPSHLTLVGVLLTPGREEAFLANSSQGNRVTRVQKGEQIEHYRLTRLTASEATLSLGDGRGRGRLAPRSAQQYKGQESAPADPQEGGRRKTGATGPEPGRGGPRVRPPLGRETTRPRYRENIRQLQRRLRTIRRQAARERRAEREQAREAAQAEEPAEAQAAEPE